MKPVWLRGKLSNWPLLLKTRETLRHHRLNTVCDEALCPNVSECFGRSVATFLIMGRTCTRACTFCAIPAEKAPPLPDPAEPERIAAAARDLGLKHIVITSVTRDDLADGGAAHFAATARALQRGNPSLTVEVLIPDLRGERTALEVLLASRPAVVNHNIETVPRLYPAVRPQADYRRSLRVLEMSKEIYPQGVTKSGLMLGLGEEPGEILAVMADLRTIGCDILTLGQYLQPSAVHHPVVRYLPPAEFADFEREGRRLGFRAIFSGPLVRSSFHAADLFAAIRPGAPGQASATAPPGVAAEGEINLRPEDGKRAEGPAGEMEECHADL